MKPILRGLFSVLGLALAGLTGTILTSCSCFRGYGGAAASSQGTIPARSTLLDADWRFHRGDVSDSNAVISAAFDDRQWQVVHLPHDYMLDDAAYNPTNNRSHGYLSYTVGWYRKHLAIPASDEGRVLRLDFDGVFRDCEVWLNGTFLGRHPGGYTPFSYDISTLVKPGEDNVISVRVDPRVFEGWWYEGGGIYRHVHLTALAPLHVAQWGTYVVSAVQNGDQGADDQADVTVQTTVENTGSAAADCTVESEIIGPDGKLVQTLKTAQNVAAAGQQDIVQRATLSHPRLWSIESPNLYELRTTILKAGRVTDATTTTFGIRTIRYDARTGFYLNGRHVELQGLCNHQDLSALGIAVPDNLQAWRVAQLQKAGCNAWRTAHNPPNESVLDSCDRLGMMVMDENRHLGDTYIDHSPAGTQATNLSDLATMIQRDRNHPSIIMWSMCNEEPLQGTAEGTNIFAAMMKVVHQYDLSRPITSAMNGGLQTNGDADVEDIVGVNYNVPAYDAIHRRRPDKPMFGSEDTNDKTTRGQYADDRTNGMSSAYNLSMKGWRAVAVRPFICGSFTWTGFDYRGEPNPYGWPDVSNNTGLLDLCGIPKDKFYYFQSCWARQPMVHLLPDNWNWAGKDGQPIRVVAFSNAKQVELFLNGNSLGVKDVPRNEYAEWQVPYAPGHLVAMARNSGRTVATEDLSTTTLPVAIQIEPGVRTLAANGEDAVVIPVSIVDAQGRVVPDSENAISVQIAGGGRLIGLGNGNPADHTPDRAGQKNVFHGRCVMIVQAGTQPADIHITVTSDGLKSARATVKAR
jgi:beta-galactosidase